MPLDPRTPVLVGVGQVGQRSEVDVPISQRTEPVALMADALRAAADDCHGDGAGARLLSRAQTLRIMVPLCWGYVNPGLLVSRTLGIEPGEQVLTAIGGNSPQSMTNQTALAIAAGELDVALIVGAECIGSRTAARRHPDSPLSWTVQGPETPPPVPFGTDRLAVSELELERGLGRPSQVFPLFENALRAAAGEGIDEHQKKVSELYARFSEVAAGNPHAWSRRAYNAEEIRTVTADNRMIGFPYPKLMNANDRVDQGAALIMCSVAAARAANVPEERWLFPVSGADANDHWFLSNRSDFHSSPAIGAAGRAALALAGRSIDDVEFLDLYSCFPCAVQIAAAELGISIDDARPLTVTGGLTFAGGPGNNYVTHSIAAMADKLRSRPGAVGLVTGLGWYVTKHSVGLWSTTPPQGGFRHDNPQPQVDASPRREAAAADFEGDVVVESYTVIHGRDGSPERALLALLTSAPSGKDQRAWATTTDSDEMAALMAEEGCGRAGRISGKGTLTLS